jgi:PAS domain S-box-containing protein
MNDSAISNLLNNPAFLNLLLESAGDNLVGLDAFGVARLCGGGVPGMLGFSKEEIVGRPFEEFLADEARSAFHRLFESAGSSSLVKNVPFMLRKKDGTTFLCHVTLHSAKEQSSGGSLIRLQPFEAESAAPEQYVVPLDILMEMGRYKTLGQITAGFIHQLRTPLQIIHTSAETMKEFLPLSEEAQAQVKLILHSAERMAASVNTLLDFLREGKTVLKKGDLNDVVEVALDFVSSECRKRAIKIVKNLSAASAVLVDAHQIQEVVVNLFVNAVESMPNGGRLIVQTEDDDPGKRVVLRVSDTGAGMDDYMVMKVASPFFSTKKGGMGLGLFLAHKILQAHSATLSVKSQMNFGTTVTVMFPASR